ncbi:MAG: hypothetical protein LBB76_10835 [Azoarcus sp.]|jgi:hypothetical protein|nr:hypothetical protein [Azoarcus sp.]
MANLDRIFRKTTDVGGFVERLRRRLRFSTFSTQNPSRSKPMFVTALFTRFMEEEADAEDGEGKS